MSALTRRDSLIERKTSSTFILFTPTRQPLVAVSNVGDFSPSFSTYCDNNFTYRRLYLPHVYSLNLVAMSRLIP